MNMECNTIAFLLIGSLGVFVVSWDKILDLHFLFLKRSTANVELAVHYAKKGEWSQTKKDVIRSLIGSGIVVIGMIGLTFC
jgi:hypothetical protein